MGTKHLIAVYTNGECKVAQLGGLDGQPEWNGVRVLQFLRDEYVGAARFHKGPDCPFTRCAFLSEDDLASMDADDLAMHPQLSAALSAEILRLVWFGPSCGIKLRNDLAFAQRASICQWGYVIDLDTQTFEIYRGHDLSAPVGRFAKAGSALPGSHPISLIQVFPINRLPSEEDFVRLVYEADPCPRV